MSRHKQRGMETQISKALAQHRAEGRSDGSFYPIILGIAILLGLYILYRRLKAYISFDDVLRKLALLPAKPADKNIKK